MNDTVKLSSSAGGKATALVLKAQSQKLKLAYNTNPKHCLACHTPILVDLQANANKFQQVKRKKFCSHPCAAQYNNLRRRKKPVVCHYCNTPVPRGRIACDACKAKNSRPAWADTVANLTKQEVFARCKNWQTARTIIRQHAVDVFDKSGRPKVCKICGYSHHAPICHVTPVAEFPCTALIREVNDLNNLVALCPTHHWEFDHGYFRKNWWRMQDSNLPHLPYERSVLTPERIRQAIIESVQS